MVKYDLKGVKRYGDATIPFNLKKKWVERAYGSRGYGIVTITNLFTGESWEREYKETPTGGRWGIRKGPEWPEIVQIFLLQNGEGWLM